MAKNLDINTNMWDTANRFFSTHDMVFHFVFALTNKNNLRDKNFYLLQKGWYVEEGDNKEYLCLSFLKFSAKNY